MKNKLYSEITTHLGHTPTPSQEEGIHCVIDFLMSRDEMPVLVLSGFAGTGKSTLISALVKMLKNRNSSVLLLAPTGRAAKVLAGYSGYKAFTIHKSIYMRKTRKDGAIYLQLKTNKSSRTIYIVDEASMLSNDPGNPVMDDFMEYVFSMPNNRVIFCGDTAQLPPVGSDESPALNPEFLSSYYSCSTYHTRLTDVVRQQSESGILYNATLIRKQFLSGEPVKLDIQYYKDVNTVIPGELKDEVASYYNNYGKDSLIVLCRSNKRANQYNKQIRNTILQYEEELCTGDLLMVTKNNYFWLDTDDEAGFIANGDIIKVEKLLRTHQVYGLRFADVIISMLDYPDMRQIETRIILDVLSADSPALDENRMKEFYNDVMNDYLHSYTKTQARAKVRFDPFFNALQIKFAYAVTVHKAQGGQWPYVILDFGFLPSGSTYENNTRWLYTAFTRATKTLWLNGFPEEMLHS